jgi:ABC-type phosphate transport system substrate-binding protein
VQDDEIRQQFRELAAAADRLRDKMRKTDRADQITAADPQLPEIRNPPEPGPVEVAPSQQPSAEVSASAPVPVPEYVSVQKIQPEATPAVDPHNSPPLTFTSSVQDEPLQEAAPGIETKRREVPIIGSLIVLLLAAIFFGLRAYRTQPAPPAIAPVRPVIPAPEIILRLHGSNTIGAQLAPTLVKAFLEDQGAEDLKVIQGKEDETAIQAVMPGDSSPKEIEIEAHGSATGFADFARNQCDIGMASRTINAKEIAQLSSLGDMTSPSSEHVIGLDGIAVIVNAGNPIESLTHDQIAGIFAGAFTNWEQVSGRGGTIHVYARNSKSGTYDTFQNLVLGSRSLVATAARIEDSRELSDRVAADPKGIGFMVFRIYEARKPWPSPMATLSRYCRPV